MSKSSDVLLAFLTGAATGAVLGVLFAPDSGKNTRESLSLQLEQYKERLKHLIEDLLKEEFSAESVKTESEKVVDDAKGKAEQLLHDVEALIEEIRTSKNNG